MRNDHKWVRRVGQRRSGLCQSVPFSDESTFLPDQIANPYVVDRVVFTAGFVQGRIPHRQRQRALRVRLV
jgi:hypothetical protein